jgi:hypothetical protein
MKDSFEARLRDVSESAIRTLLHSTSKNREKQNSKVEPYKKKFSSEIKPLGAQGDASLNVPLTSLSIFKEQMKYWREKYQKAPEKTSITEESCIEKT